MPLSLKTMLHMQKAYEALKANNPQEAIKELERYEAAFAQENAFATHFERMGALGFVAKP